MADEYTLAELSGRVGIQSRTIRSYIEQGLLRGPEVGGRGARYTNYHLQRLQAIRTLKDLHGLPLAEVRRRLFSAPAAELAILAQQSENAETGSAREPRGSALEYLKSLRSREPQWTESSPVPAAPTPLDALLSQWERAAQGKKPARRSKGEIWTSIPITPDVEIRVRGALPGDQMSRWERVADHLREVLMGNVRDGENNESGSKV